MKGNGTFALPPALRLEGYGIRLRAWSDEGLADLVALYADPEMARWTPVASPFDVVAARTYLAGAREGQAQGRKPVARPSHCGPHETAAGFGGSSRLDRAGAPSSLRITPLAEPEPGA